MTNNTSHDPRAIPDDFKTLVHSVMKGNLRKPSLLGMRTIYATYRLAVLEAGSTPEPRTARDELSLSHAAGKAAKILLDELDKWEIATQEYIDVTAPASAPNNLFLSELTKIRHAKAAILDLKDIINPWIRLPWEPARPLNSWEHWAWPLQYSFRSGMETTNKQPLGFSQDGPVARYIVAAMPTITREALTTAQVSKYLQRLDKVWREHSKESMDAVKAELKERNAELQARHRAKLPAAKPGRPGAPE